MISECYPCLLSNSLHLHDLMTSNPPCMEAGGFLRQSEQIESTSQVRKSPDRVSILPTQRASPLKPGSSKESGFIEYVDRKLLNISRRYEKRFDAQLEFSSDIGGRGYERFVEVAKDLSAIVDVVWVSGTRKFWESSPICESSLY